MEPAAANLSIGLSGVQVKSACVPEYGDLNRAVLGSWGVRVFELGRVGAKTLYYIEPDSLWGNG